MIAKLEKWLLSKNWYRTYERNFNYFHASLFSMVIAIGAWLFFLGTKSVHTTFTVIREGDEELTQKVETFIPKLGGF